MPLRPTSMLVMVVYLMATFLPCEPPIVFVGSSTGAHSERAAESGSPTASSHTMHGTHHDGAMARSPAPPHAEHAHTSPVHSGGPELRATCLCGCSDTRSMVGGGAARLGFAVAAGEGRALLDAGKLVPVDLWRRTQVEVFLLGDPIPI